MIKFQEINLPAGPGGSNRCSDSVGHHHDCLISKVVLNSFYSLGYPLQ